MSLLLKNCIVADTTSPHHTKKCSVLIEKGLITSFAGTSAEHVIDAEGKQVCVGWFDLNANFNDPGREDKEDLSSGCLAAFAGGFTDVQVIPNTNPVLESKADIEYITKFQSDTISLWAAAALSEETKGENLTELLDLQAAGASSATDGDVPVWNTELLLKALQYTAQVDMPIMQSAYDLQLSRGSQMHEGIVSTNLGLRGEPGLSEEITIKRDLDILEYAGGRLHFSRVSSAGSLPLIKEAKKKGLRVTADVAIHSLLFTDVSVGDFDTNLKVIPPFRTEEDRQALLEGVKSGVIDAICSNHRPHDLESKQLEFDLALPGAISLQTFYPSLLQLTNDIPFEVLLDRVTAGPRSVLGLTNISLKEGVPAKLTLLDPEQTWTLNDETNHSKSRNSPFWGSTLQGKVVATVNGHQFRTFE